MKKFISLLLIVLLLTCGCFLINDDEGEKKEIYNKGLPIIQSYIMNKYGFEFKESYIVDTSYPCAFNTTFGCNGLNGIMEVKAYHDNKSYNILVNTDSSYCADTYEREKLFDKIKKYVSNYLNINNSDFRLDVKIDSFDYKDYYLNSNVSELTNMDDLPSTALAIITTNYITENSIKNIFNNLSFVSRITYVQTFNSSSYDKIDSTYGYCSDNSGNVKKCDVFWP